MVVAGTRGWLDFVCPMNYTLDARVFGERAARHRAALPAGFPLVQGIGIASGWIGFCYRPEHTRALLTPCALGGKAADRKK
jgi:hypothetical protein